MRRSFAVTTVLALFLAILLGVARYEARYSTKLALRDLGSLSVPGDYLASSIDESNLAPAVVSFLQSAPPGSDPLQALAVIEMRAAGLFSPNPNPVDVSVQYQELLKACPTSALFHQRYAAYLLTRLQQMALKAPGHRLTAAGSATLSETEDIAMEARRELDKAAALDPHNSLASYEIAWSHLVFGDNANAAEWLHKGLDQPDFDPGDDLVMRAAMHVLTAAKVPPLEQLIVAYHLTQFQPSFLARRMESLTAGMLSDKEISRLGMRGRAYGDHLAAIEDLSDKLLQSSCVLRQTQSALVTSGLLWRKVATEAPQGAANLQEAAHRQLAAASYRYLLVGWQRSGLGLYPQQSVLELDTPPELRLPFSSRAQDISRALLMAMAALLLPAIAVGAISLKVKATRQLALALTVLFVFTTLAYSASFYSTVRERLTVGKELERRLKSICSAPDYVRDKGQPATRDEFQTDIPKKMLFTYDYTMQAGRVLAYVGTRDSYDWLIDSLANPRMHEPTAVIAALEEATGITFETGGLTSASPKAEVDKAIASWQKWWRDNRNSYPETASGAPGAKPTHGA